MRSVLNLTNDIDTLGLTNWSFSHILYLRFMLCENTARKKPVSSPMNDITSMVIRLAELPNSNVKEIASYSKAAGVDLINAEL